MASQFYQPSPSGEALSRFVTVRNTLPIIVAHGATNNGGFDYFGDPTLDTRPGSWVYWAPSSVGLVAANIPTKYWTSTSAGLASFNYINAISAGSYGQNKFHASASIEAYFDGSDPPNLMGYEIFDSDAGPFRIWSSFISSDDNGETWAIRLSGPIWEGAIFRYVVPAVDGTTQILTLTATAANQADGFADFPGTINAPYDPDNALIGRDEAFFGQLFCDNSSMGMDPGAV